MKQRSSLVSIAIVLGLSFISTSSPAASKYQIYKLLTSSSSIYEDPNPHSRIIKKLPKNTSWIVKLSGVKKYSRTTWFHVSWNKNEGWINKNVLELDHKATAIVDKNPNCLLRKKGKTSCVVK